MHTKGGSSMERVYQANVTMHSVLSPFFFFVLRDSRH